jgi:hypothetical protein
MKYKSFHISSIHIGNLLKGHQTHLCGQKIDEFCGGGRIGHEGELVWCSVQQLL